MRRYPSTAFALGVLCVYIAACWLPTAQHGLKPQKPAYAWPKYSRTMDAMLCAATRSNPGNAKLLVGIAAWRVEVVPRKYIGGDNCRTLPGKKLVRVADDFKSAKASCLRHEFFEHVIPIELGRGSNALHSREWKELHSKVNTPHFADCWNEKP